MTKRIILLLITMLLASCTGRSETSDALNPLDEAELDYESLVEAMLAQGAEVTPAGSFTSIALAGDTRLLQVNGRDVHVYEYGDAALAGQEATYISSDGGSINIPNPSDPDISEVSMIDWIATPHFYWSGRLIVQYVGDDPDIIALLESLLGPQFAGGQSEGALPLMVMVIEPSEKDPASFEQAVRQATSVVLAEVVGVEQGPNLVDSVEILRCRPTQVVSIKILKAYKGSLAPDQTHTIYQEAGATDLEMGCGNNPGAEKAMLIFGHDPLYEVNQRYLMALSPLSTRFNLGGQMEVNPDLVARFEPLNPSLVLVNGRLYVEQGGHVLLEQADVVATAYDEYGRAIPGESTGNSLAETEVLIAGWLNGEPAGGPGKPEALAYQTLQTFLTQLHEGQYEAAASSYGGDYDWLREVNPDVPRDDWAALLARGCELNGLACMSVARLELILKKDGFYTFSAQFANEDGSVLTLGGCCGDDGGAVGDAFEFRVVQEGEQFLVQELPPYRP